MRIPGWNVAFDASEIPWRETDSPGVRWVLLESLTDAAAGPDARPGASVLIQMDPGCGYPAHRHIGGEDVLVLAGGYRDERGEHRAGSVVHYADGSVHAPIALGDPGAPPSADNPACVLFAIARAGIELSARDE